MYDNVNAQLHVFLAMVVFNTLKIYVNFNVFVSYLCNHTPH